jgi:Exocyst complex component Sec5
MVHSGSTYPSLATGLETLRDGIQQESGALKQLVTGDFDRFVRCKSGIDEVYERMIEGGFVSHGEYGTTKLRTTLDGILLLQWGLMRMYC